MRELQVTTMLSSPPLGFDINDDPTRAAPTLDFGRYFRFVTDTVPVGNFGWLLVSRAVQLSPNQHLRTGNRDVDTQPFC